MMTTLARPSLTVLEEFIERDNQKLYSFSIILDETTNEKNATIWLEITFKQMTSIYTF